MRYVILLAGAMLLTACTNKQADPKNPDDAVETETPKKQKLQNII